jgi:putative hydrolase of the HAD superfamily
VTSAGEGRGDRISGVLFDYGETLVGFTRPDEALGKAERRILALLRASGRAGPSPAGVRAVQERVEREVIDHQRSGDLEEIDVAAVSSRAYAEAGVHLDAALLDEVLRVEQEAWWYGAHLDPEAVPLLDTLRGRGLRVGLCSNAPYRVESLRAQLAFLGLDSHLDAVTFSAEVGWRKPSPRIFDAALRSLGTEADRTVMVGDSESVDIAGAHASGLRGVLLSRNGDRGPGAADAVIAALRELPGALRNMGIYLD